MSKEIAWYKCKKCGWESYDRDVNGCDHDLRAVYWYEDKLVKPGYERVNGNFWFEGAD